MITFVIPVKSRKVSSDWSRFCLLLERTLISICNQTDTDFRVVAACHEIPEIKFKHKNLHFIQVAFEPPVFYGTESQEEVTKRREIDKGEKIKRAVAYAEREFDTDYIMTVDSDDCISNRIAEFVNKSGKNVPGWHIEKGYLHVQGQKLFLFTTSKFGSLCGSSVIVKPELMKHFYGVDPIFYFNHTLKVLNGNIVLRDFPFSGGIYCMANGENHFMSLQKAKSLNDHSEWMSLEGLKRLYRKIGNYGLRLITPKLRREFSFYPLT